MTHEAPVRLALALDLAAAAERLPTPSIHPTLDLPLLAFDPHAASAPDKAAMALDCALGRLTCVSGGLDR